MAGSLVVKNPDEYSWIRYIKQRIRQNKNMLMVLSGPTGSGKSWSALKIAELLDDEFSSERVVFKGSELMALINSGKLDKGSVIVWDEAGIDISSKNWMSTTNKLLNFLFQTFRHKCFVLIFTVPYSSFVDKSTRKLFHAELRTESINFNDETVKLKPQLIQYNGRLDKFYYKYLRVSNRKGVAPITYWYVPKPSSQLITSYEQRKKEFTDKLNLKISNELKVLENDDKDDATNILLSDEEALVYSRLRNGSMQVDIYKEAIKGYNTLTELRQRLEIILKKNIDSKNFLKNVHSMTKRGVDISKYRLV